jgi:hypothetical protein
MLRWLPRDAEQLAMEPGGEGTANARSTRSSGRRVGWTCTLAPGETTRRAGNRLMLAAAVCELPYVAAKRRKVPASRPSDTDCCPFAAHGHVPDADGLARERSAWSGFTRPPVIRGFALCLPLSPVCSAAAASQSRWQEMVRDAGECPAPRWYARWFAVTNAHRLPTAFLTLTRVVCCPSAASLGRVRA